MGVRGRVMWVRAKDGYRFIPTESGMRIGCISTKYTTDPILLKRYSISAPQAWLDNGYIEEVKIDG